MLLHLPVSLALSLLPNLSGPAPRPADWLLQAVPADAVAVAQLAPLDDLRARWHKNALGQLAETPEVAPMIVHVGKMIDGMLAEARAELSEEQKKLADPHAWCEALHGAIAGFGVIDADAKGGGAGLLIEMAEPKQALEAQLDLALGQLRRESGAHERIETYAQTEIQIFEHKPGTGSDGDLEGVLMFRTGGVAALLAGDSLAHMEQIAHGVIDALRAPGKSAGFAASPVLAAARAGAPAPDVFELTVDVRQALAAIERHEKAQAAAALAALPADAQPEAGAGQEDDWAIPRQLGLLDIRYAHAAVSIGEGENAELAFFVDAPAQSVLQQFGALFGPLPVGMLSALPSEGNVIGIGKIDVNGIWKQVQELVQRFAPQEYTQMRQAIDGMVEVTGLDWERDLLAQIPGNFAAHTAPMAPQEVEQVSEELAATQVPAALLMGSAYVIELADAETVESFVDHAVELGGISAQIESQEYEGHWLQSFDTGFAQLHWTFAPGRLVISNSAAPLVAVLSTLAKPEGPSAAKNPRTLRAANDHAGAAMLSVSDTALTMHALLDMPKTVLSLAGLAAMNGNGETDEVFEALQSVPWADAAVADKHFHGSILSTFETRDGRIGFRAKMTP